MTGVPRRLGRGVALLIAAFCAMAGLVLTVGGAANAADLPNVISNVSVVEDAAAPSSQVRIDLDWSVPDSARSGDTFTLTLPPELARYTTSFDLKAPDGSVVAHATVSASGVVTFTLTSYVDTHDNVSGTAFLHATFEVDQPAGTAVVLDFTTNGATYTDQVTVAIDVVDRLHPVKAGSWTDADDQGLTKPEGAIYWTVASPKGPYGQVVFEDVAQPGQTIDCASVSMASTTTWSTSTGFLTNLAPVPASDYTVVCTDQKVTVTMTRPLADGEVAQIGFTSTITDPTLSTYTNTGSVTFDGTKESASADVVRYDAGGAGDGDGMGPVTVTKVVEGHASAATGPFEVSVDCVWNGASAPGYPQTLTFDGAGTQTLSAPIASVCTATETADGGATASTVSPDVTVVKDSEGPVTLTVTNTFALPVSAVTPRGAALAVALMALIGLGVVSAGTRRTSR